MKLLNYIKFIKRSNVGQNDMPYKERRKMWQIERKSLRYAKQKLRRRVR